MSRLSSSFVESVYTFTQNRSSSTLTACARD
jgi:hypothetical protein